VLNTSEERVADFLATLDPQQPRALFEPPYNRLGQLFVRFAAEDEESEMSPPPPVEGEDIDELREADEPEEDEEEEDDFVEETETDRHPDETTKVFDAIDKLRAKVRGTDRSHYVRIAPVFHKLEKSLHQLAELLKDAPHPRPSKMRRAEAVLRRASIPWRNWWFVTKRGDQPYSGPAWNKTGMTPQFFKSKIAAEKAAAALKKVNPVGFTVKKMPTQYKPGKYPLMVNARSATFNDPVDLEQISQLLESYGLPNMNIRGDGPHPHDSTGVAFVYSKKSGELAKAQRVLQHGGYRVKKERGELVVSSVIAMDDSEGERPQEDNESLDKLQEEIRSSIDSLLNTFKTEMGRKLVIEIDAEYRRMAAGRKGAKRSARALLASAPSSPELPTSTDSIDSLSNHRTNPTCTKADTMSIKDVLRRYAQGDEGEEAAPSGGGGHRGHAPFHDEFIQEMKSKGKQFKSPKTGNKIMFGSLPYEKQKEIYHRWMHGYIAKHKSNSRANQTGESDLYNFGKDRWQKRGLRTDRSYARHEATSSHGDYTYHPDQGTLHFDSTDDRDHHVHKGITDADHAHEVAAKHHSEFVEGFREPSMFAGDWDHPRKSKAKGGGGEDDGWRLHDEWGRYRRDTHHGSYTYEPAADGAGGFLSYTPKGAKTGPGGRKKSALLSKGDLAKAKRKAQEHHEQQQTRPASGKRKKAKTKKQ